MVGACTKQVPKPRVGCKWGPGASELPPAAGGEVRASRRKVLVVQVRIEPQAGSSMHRAAGLFQKSSATNLRKLDP